MEVRFHVRHIAPHFQFPELNRNHPRVFNHLGKRKVDMTPMALA